MINGTTKARARFKGKYAMSNAWLLKASTEKEQTLD